MSKPIRLPDAMPDVEKPTLLVVCDGHHCRLLVVGGHSIVEQETIDSREPEFSDRQGSKPGPSSMGKGGAMMGVGDTNQLEATRMRTFANTVMKRLDEVIRSQKIQSLHLSAPAKALAAFREHMTTTVKGVTVQTLDGQYLKEPALQVLVRFRPDLKDAVAALRDEEGFSPRKHLPK
jgi:protein required for attachment to host cells